MYEKETDLGKFELDDYMMCYLGSKLLISMTRVQVMQCFSLPPDFDPKVLEAVGDATDSKKFENFAILKSAIKIGTKIINIKKREIFMELHRTFQHLATLAFIARPN